MLIDAEQTPQTSRITPENFAEFIKLIEQGSINANSAQTVLTDMFETGHDPSDIVEAKQLGLITDESELSEVVRQVIEANQEKADQYRAGKIALMKFFIGQVMKATGGRADPEICQRILVEQLDGKSVK
jgi:aspartyl-tRNA(Asn)/glutamyl-tRNA(Gln) amidotransferase subunit B